MLLDVHAKMTRCPPSLNSAPVLFSLTDTNQASREQGLELSGRRGLLTDGQIGHPTGTSHLACTPSTQHVSVKIAVYEVCSSLSRSGLHLTSVQCDFSSLVTTMMTSLPQSKSTPARLQVRQSCVRTRLMIFWAD